MLLPIERQKTAKTNGEDGMAKEGTVLGTRETLHGVKDEGMGGAHGPYVV